MWAFSQLLPGAQGQGHHSCRERNHFELLSVCLAVETKLLGLGHCLLADSVSISVRDVRGKGFYSIPVNFYSRFRIYLSEFERKFDALQRYRQKVETWPQIASWPWCSALTPRTVTSTPRTVKRNCFSESGEWEGDPSSLEVRRASLEQEHMK